MEEKRRKTGTGIIGDVPWGTHICQFYRTKEDLLDILVPYFKAGLENNEFCMWITSEPLKAEDAKASLKKVVKNLDHFIEKGQIEILDYSEWYTKSGKFDADNVLQGWVEKENQALKRGYDGLRLSGNTFWLGKREWRNFTDYEEEVSKVIAKYRMIAIFNYSLDQCGASEVTDVVSNHQFALIRREGEWVTIESSEHKRAEEALGKSVQLLRDTGEMAKVGSWELDLSTKEVLWTEEVGRIHGVEPGYKPKLEEALDFYAPESRPDVEAVVKKAAEMGEPYDLESLFIPRGSKNKIWVRSLGRAVYSGGKIVKLTGTFQNIDKYKRAGEEYKTILRTAMDGFWVTDTQGRFLDTNDAYCRLIGYRRDEMLTMRISDVEVVETPGETAQRIKKIMEVGGDRFETRHRCKDGRIVDVEISVNYIDAGGGRLFVFARDITERKRAEEALRKKSEEQALLLDNIQTQIWYLTDKETYGAVNKARAEFFGKKSEEMENKKVCDVLSKGEADICMSGYTKVFEKRKQSHTEEWIMNAKGEKRLLSIIKTPKLNENGDVEYVVCSAEDITERKRAEDGIKKLNKELERRVIERTAQLEAVNKDMQKEITERNEAEVALKASETCYRRLFESAKDGILLLDADTGQLTDVNPYLVEMLGYSHNEFLGKKLWEIGLFKHIAENQAGFQKLQSEKYIRYENLPLETKEGRHIDVEFVSNVYLVDHKTVIQCNIRDITERRRAEEELKKHEERLEELVKERTRKIRELERQRAEIEKLAAAGLMAARIAHEINNPLAGIKNSFLLVKDAILQDHPYYKYVERIDNEIDRIARIVRQMFDVYRPEQEIKKEFSVDKTIYEVVALLEAAWRENNITIEMDSKPITMEMPEGLLRQVLYNILVNAIEASPRGGVVKIMTEVGNKILTLSISDQGVGIPLEIHSRIFEPFFTSKDGFQKGLGLGLAVSKDIVKKLGGYIDFESEPGKGALFRINLPLKSGERR